MTGPQLIPLIALLLLAGFFAGTTIAFQHINKFSMEIKRKKGLFAGRILAHFHEQPIRFVASGTIGFLACIVIFSILLNYALMPYWEQIPFGTFNFLYLKILAQFLIAAILILLFSLLLPRSLFRAQANRLLPVFAFPISAFAKLLYPVTSLMTSLANWILQYLFNVKITSEGVPYDAGNGEAYLFSINKEENSVKNLNTLFFENALNLPQIKIRNCLIPRKEIVALEYNSSLDEVRQEFISSQYSKLIIYEKNIDNIVGYVHQLDLFNGATVVKDVLHPILAVPETMNVITLLTQMTRDHKSIAWVVDEFGGTAGIVTLEDLLEEIFGDIRDEHDTHELVDRQIAEKEYLLSGRLELSYLKEKYGFVFGETESETLSGFIITGHGSIPGERERIIIGNFEFDITRVSETRIEMVKLRILK